MVAFHMYTVIVPVLVPVAVLVSILTSMCLFGIVVTSILRTKKTKGELIIYLNDDLNKQ